VLACVWHGDVAEAYALAAAIEHNCECKPPVSCGAHAAMLEQRFLNGLLFGRYLAQRLLVEEFDGV
jgi:hypothetical protein